MLYIILDKHIEDYLLLITFPSVLENKSQIIT